MPAIPGSGRSRRSSNSRHDPGLVQGTRVPPGGVGGEDPGCGAQGFITRIAWPPSAVGILVPRAGLAGVRWKAWRLVLSIPFQVRRLITKAEIRENTVVWKRAYVRGMSLGMAALA